MTTQRTMDRFYQLAAQRDALEIAQGVIAQQLLAVNIELDLVSARVTRDVPLEPAVQANFEFAQDFAEEEEVPAEMIYAEEQASGLADLMLQ